MKLKRAFITGIAGFAGSFLAEELLAQGYIVTGTYLPGESLNRLDAIIDKIEINPLDFAEPDIIPDMIKKIKPQYIYHLAAQPSVGRSFKQPLETYTANFMGSFYLLEAARNLKGLKGFLMVTSADIYGSVKPKEPPLTEDRHLQPVSPYGVSKAAADMMAYQYHKNYDLPVIRVRSFNHSGPRQARGFVITDLSYQIARLERNRARKIIKIGNLSAKRDISDVRDIVHGYRLALERGKPGEVYHLCCGKAYQIKSLMNRLLKMANVEIKTEIDPKLARPTEVPILKGDPSKAEKELGYKRKYSIDDTLRDCLEYYRSLQGGMSA